MTETIAIIALVIAIIALLIGICHSHNIGWVGRRRF